MDKHACCITTSLLGIDVKFRNSGGHTYAAEEPCNVDYLTAIQHFLLYLHDSGGMAEETAGPLGNIYLVFV